MSPLTTSTPNPWLGSSTSSKIFRAPWWPLPTIATSSITPRAGSLSWIAGGAFLTKGNYSTWLEAKEKRIEQEQRQEASHQKAIKAELEWVRSNPKGRQAKNKARLQRFEELNSQEFQSRNETNEIYIPPGARLGDKVIEVSGLRKAFGDRLLI